MSPIDFAKAHPRSYSAPEHPEVVHLEPATYVAITGQGAPGGAHHLASIDALYTVASWIQKLGRNQDKEFELPPLEGQWWFDENKPAAEVPRETWHFRLLIRVPDWVTEGQVAAAKKENSKETKATQIDKVEIEKLNEAKSVQMLHVGPYDAEPETVAKMFTFMKERGLVPNGLHHEIYLSDIRKGDPARARTILRYPVKGKTET
jgi:hypothetical protein